MGCAASKIDDIGFVRVIDHNIVGFKISVEDIFVGEEAQSLAYLISKFKFAGDRKRRVKLEEVKESSFVPFHKDKIG